VSQAWKSTTTEPFDETVVDDLARLISVLVVDADAGDRSIGQSALSQVLVEGEDSTAAMNVLDQICGRLMSNRAGADETEMRRLLMSEGVKLTSSPRFRSDINRLKAHSAGVADALQRYEVIEAEVDEPISIVRECQPKVLAASLEGSFLIVGEPGAGKSGVLNALARDLREADNDVIELAVDRFSVETLEGLSRALGLDHDVVEVLEAWDGNNPAWLIIDALDATRGGRGENVFRALIERILEGKSRWRIVASIRTFDLQMGQQLRQLFRGQPPEPDLREQKFPNVRHVKVPTWSEKEFKELLDLLPRLHSVMEGAPDTLYELASVPFNTRLIGDLLRDGMLHAKIHHISSQLELLKLYWEVRVERHGFAALNTLRIIIERMLDARALRARLSDVSNDPQMLQTLSSEGVITTVDENRGVQFRHHVLFDYAASRTVLDTRELIDGIPGLTHQAGVGLMLAPALRFVLAEIWTYSDNREEFWSAIVHLLGGAAADPVVRSVAGRAAAELPTLADETEILVHALIGNGPEAVAAFRHIAGALAVRIEDQSSIRTEPWTSLLGHLSRNVRPVASTARFLVFQFLRLELTSSQRQDLGCTARALLTVAFESAEVTNLAVTAIQAVCETFATNPGESKSLLYRVFDPERLSKNGWEEVPAVCDKIAEIASVDPEFAGDIFRHTFAYDVTEERETRLGSSRILPMTSSARQDYGMARYSLTEFAPTFLGANPGVALESLADAVEGWVAEKHPASSHQEVHEFSLNGLTATVLQDRSHIWAHDPQNAYGHDGEALVKAITTFFRDAAEHDAVELSKRLLRRGKLALFWARLFMVAAERQDGLTDFLLPFACTEDLLLLDDTRKDAIDLVANGYDRMSLGARTEFEKRVLNFNFTAFRNPTAAREAFMRRLFARIGVEKLSTTAAKSVLDNTKETGGSENERPFKVRTYSSAPEPYYWLSDLDRQSENNARAMTSIDELRKQLSAESPDVMPTMPLKDLLALLNDPLHSTRRAGVDPRLESHSEGIVGQALSAIVKSKVLAAADEDTLRAFLDLLGIVSMSSEPRLEENTEANFETGASWGSPAARVEAAEATLDLLLQFPKLYQLLEVSIDSFLADVHPAVRLQAGLRLVRLWDIDREGFWRRLRTRLDVETNLGVLEHLIRGVLGSVVHADPGNAEPIVLRLLDRFQMDAERRDRLMLALAGDIAILVVTYGREKPRSVLENWIANSSSHSDELAEILSTLRQAFVLDLETGDERGAAIRRRAMSLALMVVSSANEGLRAHFERNVPTADQVAEGTRFAKLIDHVCRELFFAAGGRHRGETDNVLSQHALKIFLNEYGEVLRRIGDYGTPPTIHYLVQLLEVLVAVDPQVVFDLTVHALKNGGKQSGYQFESLGADQFVKLVGIFLADHKELFLNQSRRQDLADCLDIFMDAGWASARRLVYRLPELLQ
jgi:hypothetical protein